jgi:hypothetical protein
MEDKVFSNCCNVLLVVKFLNLSPERIHDSCPSPEAVRVFRNLDVVKTTLKEEESCSHLETWLIQRGKFL